MAGSWRSGAARSWWLGGFALLMAIALSLLPPALAAAPGGSGAGGSEAPAAPGDQNATVAAGSFELAKVRILGVPALTVASPVVGQQDDAPNAQRRAEVIEGNLRLLYDPQHLCSESEQIAEWILLRVLGGNEGACEQPPLQPVTGSAPEQLVVQRRQLPGGDVVLEARVPERSEPLPLLTITRADASLNGISALALGERWQQRLQSRLRHARRVMQPADLRRRLQFTLTLELALALLTVGTLCLWRHNRHRRARLLGRRRPTPDRALEHRLQLHQAFGLLLLLAVLLELMVMLALGVMVMPGKVPLGLQLLLQPVHSFLKVLIVGLLALLVRSLATFLLHQWADSARVPVEEQARREQRHRSLLRVSHRLIDLACVIVAGGWILIDIPGIRAASSSLLLAGGALLGGLALVFQGLLRDFAAGLAVLLEDRYAIGDWVEIGGLEGDVVDVGVLSTQLRCLDHRVAVIQNSSFDRVVNHTKLRSGEVVKLLVSHRCTDIDHALAVMAEELALFHTDTAWGPRLLAAPLLRGVSATGPLGITVSVLLTTVAGEQWACSRELQRRLVARFQREDIPLADGLELAARS
ncbi:MULTISPECIES: mechanosensitive ion channel family protein [unclassified Cyanobium]|uniref:mechanosensitive ion channel family protein n=1 Tax=unclassified Cyanobium TaxID=2627006 RepID=UPI0020CFBE9B|nr:MULTISPECIES: mechanosensitive ion channel domain-containing protein [unclassified Cyanobium]MCP9835726.1 mechanosensitive ion channel [Cyanobium sp. La Preciosa 7G6]MCP9938516.1 mechanosensitive ion channel [Cyanobium sp. Aljojuca 7A6]